MAYQIKYLNILHDTKNNCYSVMVEMNIDDFLDLVQHAYESRGGIAGQRSGLKTKTALTIRSRMVKDVKAGTILPAMVLGVHMNKLNSEKLSKDNFSEFINEISKDSISIIDGMQRTTALEEAKKENALLKEQKVRIEFWIADKLNNLIYRMLVLNTGQVPWEISRQLETVYSQLLKLINEKISIDEIEIINKDIKPRQLSDYQFESHKIVTYYLTFASRSYDFNLKDKVAEDFARLDTIETNAVDNFVDYFVNSFEILINLNKEFSRANLKNGIRIKSGADIFNSDTALTAFFAAISVQLFKSPGYKIPEEDKIAENMKRVSDNIQRIIMHLKTKNDDELNEFLALDALDERLNQKSGRIGEFERGLFFRSFTHLINQAKELEEEGSLNPCWRA